MKRSLFACLAVVATTIALAPALPAQAATTAAAGIQIRGAHSQKCLATQSPSTQILQTTCSPSVTTDKFKLVLQTDGSYWIQSVDTGKCLNVQSASPDNSKPVIQYPCSSSATNNRWWAIPIAGTAVLKFVALHSGKCLNVPGNSTGDVGLIQYTCSAGGAENEQFYLPPAATKAGVAVPNPRFNAVNARQTTKRAGLAVAPVTISYVSLTGVPRQATYYDPRGVHPGSPVTVGSSADVPATGTAVTAMKADGRFRFLWQDSRSGDYWIADEDTPGSGAATGTDFEVGGSAPSRSVLAPVAPGLLGAFAVVGGALWFAPDTAGATRPLQGAWRSLGGVGLVGTPTVIATATGARVFVLTSSGTMTTATLDNTTLSSWTDLGGTGLTGVPAAVSAAGNVAQVFIRSATGGILTKRQGVDGAFPAQWTTIETPGSGVLGSVSAVVQESYGDIVITARDTNNVVYFSQLNASGGFSRGWWVMLKGDGTDAPVLALSDPTVFSYVDPTPEGILGYGIIFQSTDSIWWSYFAAGAPGAKKLPGGPAVATRVPEPKKTFTLHHQ